MNREEAEASVGKMVYTCSPAPKMSSPPTGSPCTRGPYLLKQVTKGGAAILEGWEEGPVRLRWIALKYGAPG